MKKRVLSVLLVIALLVAVGIVAAQANETAPTAAEIIAAANAMTFPGDGSDFPAKCPACNADVTWKALTPEMIAEKQAAETAFAANGHYYLTGDVTGSGALIQTSAGNLCLHLNGKKIEATSMRANNTGALAVNDNRTFNVFDNADGKVVADVGSSGGTVFGWSGTMNIYGGTWSSNGWRIAMDIRSAAVHVYGGTIANGHGLRIAGAAGSFNLHGGEVKVREGVNYTGGLIMTTAAGASINITGGTVAGYAVHMYAAGNLNISGGTVGKIGYEAGVAGNVTISGNPVMNELLVDTVKPTFGALTSGAKLGFGEYTGIISTAYNTKPEAEAIVATFPEIPGRTITVNDAKELVLGAKTYTPAEIVTLAKAQDLGTTNTNAFCYHCNKNVDWIALTNESDVYDKAEKFPSGHYFLAEDISKSGAGEVFYIAEWTLPGDVQEICLHLNNHTLENATGATAIKVWTKTNLNIMGEGNVKAGGTGWPTVVMNAANTSTNIYGGNYSGWRSLGLYRGNINVYDAALISGHVLVGDGEVGNVTFHGGTFSDIRVKAATDTLTLNNTTVTKLTVETGVANIGSGSTVTTVDATVGGVVNVNGGAVTTLNGGAGTANVNSGNVTTLTTGAGATNVAGGTVGTLTASAGTVTLSGAPTVNNLTATVAVDAKGLTGGQITLGNLEGVFTTAFDSMQLAEAAKAYFVAASGMVIKTTDAKELTYVVLACTTPAEIIDFANNEMPNVAGFAGTVNFSAFCPHCNKPVTWTALGETGSIGYGGGHFFLTVDRAGFYCDAAVGNNGAVLFLNGKTITGNIGCGTDRMITILGNGNVTGTTSAALTGAGTFNIYGGTYVRNTTGTNVSSVAANGPFYFYGGTIAAAEDYGIFMNAGQYYINGGTVEGRLYMDNNGANDPSFILNGGTMSGPIGVGRGTVTLNGGTFTGTEISVGGSETHATALNLGGVTFTENVELNNHGRVGVVTFGADFDQTITVNIAKLTEEAGYGRTETLYKATTAGLNGTVYAHDVDDNRYGLVYDSVANNGNLVLAKTSIVNGENVSWYQDLQAAVDAFNGTGYIKLYTDEETAVLGKTIAIDLNGKKEIAVSGTGSIVGMDTYTQVSFARTPGYVLIDEGASITVAAPETTTADDGTVTGFLPVTDDNGETTFTYFTMKLSGVALKANNNTVGLYYKGTWNFNDSLPAGKVEAGVAVNVYDQNVENPFAGGIAANTANGYYSTDAASVANGQPVTSVLVNDIMKSTDRTADLNSQYGQMKIKAAAFIAVNGQEIVTGIKNLSVCDVLKLIEGNNDAYAANETKLANFYNTWKTLANLDTWGLTKIGQ